MTAEQKQLLIKDLSARLSHGVRCFIEDDYDVSRDGTLYEMDLDEGTCDFKDTGIGQGYWYTNVVNVKPYLRPMLSMTEDEKTELSDLLYKDFDGTLITYTRMDKVLSWLNQHHFDYRGLIEQGLALPAPEKMYNP